MRGSGEWKRESNVPPAFFQIPPVIRRDLLQVMLEARLDGRGQNGHPVPGSLPAPGTGASALLAGNTPR